ncbi:MAG: NUDIX domain-containing protein [Nitrospiraceae bacterium]|nr:MAG: NUDIX domain-containing protein [Nitrospiraceae bacterium]
MTEHVLVIPATLLPPSNGRETGVLITDGKDRIFHAILSNHAFMPRDEAEYNDAHRQVIPYVLIRNGDRFLLLKRLSRQREKRLHNKYSLGIGGHVNPDPAGNGDNVIMSGLYRELHEEVFLDDPGEVSFVGVINDESSSVSRVHLGLLFELHVRSSGYRVLETEKMTARWVSHHDLGQYYSNLETWSRIVYDQHIKKGAKGSVT